MASDPSFWLTVLVLFGQPTQQNAERLNILNTALKVTGPYTDCGYNVYAALEAKFPEYPGIRLYRACEKGDTTVEALTRKLATKPFNTIAEEVALDATYEEFFLVTPDESPPRGVAIIAVTVPPPLRIVNPVPSVQLSPRPPLLHPEFPSIEKCQSYPPGNQHISFKLVDRFESLDDRLLFTAQTGSTTVLVKFTRSYSPALHTFCHNLGHAPQLLGYQELSGGWFVVVMEFLEGWKHLYSLQLSDSQRFAAWEQIKTLADTFHKAGFVHGDLRTANILAPLGWDSMPTLPKLRVVDYDWGGVRGTARYPTPRLTSELLTRPRHTLDDLIITEEDDYQVLLRTFQILTPDIAME